MLSSHETFKAKTSRLLYVAAGLLLAFNGFQMMFSSSNLTTTILSLASVLFGLSYAFFGAFGLGSGSRFQPRVELTEDSIRIKTKIFTRMEEIKLQDIRNIEFGQYRVKVKISKQVRDFDFTRNPESSIQVKDALREWCEERNLEVLGG